MRVCVLSNPMLTRFEEQALERVAALDDVRINRVVVDDSVGGSAFEAGADAINEGGSLSLSDLKLFADVVRENGLEAFIYADQKFGWMLGETAQREWLTTKPVGEIACLADATLTECEPVSAGGAWNTLPENVTAEISRSCDVVIRFGFGLLKGPILDATEYGVLSVHTTDIKEYRGMGPKVSFLHDDPTATITLQRLSEKIDGGEIVDLRSQDLPEYPTLDDVWNAIYAMQTETFAAGIEALRDEEFTPTVPDDLGTYYPHSLQQRNIMFVSKLLLKNNWRRLRKHFG